MKKENYKEISTRCNLFLTSKTGTTGITLIALVITIIVLLILAAVSITTLTGENGLLTKANDAKVATEKAEAKEQVEMAVMASYDDNGILDYDKLKENLNKIPKIAEIPDEITEESFPLKVKVNGYEVTIENNGKVKGDNPETPPTGEKSTLEQAKDNGTIFGEKTTLEDEYRNKVVVPENFKIAKDSATDVAGGVVIEDASEELTKGSQFVWIPVGDVKKGTETKNIKLSRYTFANGTSDKGSNGNILEKGTSIEQGQTAIKNGSYEFTENLEGNGNAVADGDVYNAFVNETKDGNKTKVEKTGGYYIGRYEARTPNPLSAQSSDEIPSPQLTEKADDNVYNYVTQLQASKLCKKMYEGKETFKSDLMNSYAWDTAIVFVQTFDDRKEKGIPYSYQNSLNTGDVATTGTNNLSTNNDKICNIWDMASNCYEWTSETCSYARNPCTLRGGYYYLSSVYTSYRNELDANYGTDKYSFRPLLVV